MLEAAVYVIIAAMVSAPFLFWWKRWRKLHKTEKNYDELLLVIFLIRQRDTGTIHQVFFGEISGVIAPSLGNTHGRYENLSYMCPIYEYQPIAGGLVYPESMHVQDLHNSVGDWLDRYWSSRFNKRKL